MNQRAVVLSIVIIVVAFIFVMGSVAIYASAAQGSYDKQKDSYSRREAAQYTAPAVINQYYQQQPVQAVPGNNCNQQVTGYYNNQPNVQCVPSDPSSSQSSITYPNQQVTKIYVQMSGGYYPSPPYYQRYYWYPYNRPYPYYPYPKYPYPPFSPKVPYYPKPWW